MSDSAYIQMEHFLEEIERKTAINPSLGEVNPTKRSKKAEERRIRLKQELGGILTPQECCFLGSKINPGGKKEKFKELLTNYTTYSQELKEQISIPYIQNLESEERIGEVIVDWGSGFNPLSSHLTKEHTCITIDAVSVETEFHGEHKIICDIRKLTKDSLFNMFVLEEKLKEILGVETVENSADFMIFSEILNYIPSKKVLGYSSKLLKNGGRIFIVNEPDRGIYRNFDRNRVTNNETLIKNLKKLGYELEDLLIVGNKTISYGGIFAESTYFAVDPTTVSKEKFKKCLCVLVAKKVN